MDDRVRFALLAWQAFEEYRTIGNRTSLVTALQYVREGLSRISASDGLRSLYLDFAVVIMVAQHQTSGDPAVLKEAITHARELLELTPTGHDERPDRLVQVASLLTDWVCLTDDQEALAEATLCLREALQQTPQDHPNRLILLKNLASCLGIWYDLTGQRESLEEGIAHAREALALTASDDARRPSRLETLGRLLNTLYSLTGKRDALEAAIRCAREAVSLTEADDDGRSLRISNLACHLGDWFELTGNENALDEAIAWTREALSLMQPGEKHRAGFLQNLSVHLCAKYKHTGNQELLAEALSCAAEARDLTPPGHADYPSRLNNLATRLADQYTLTGDREALAEAIAHARKALELTPAGHGRRAALLNNLGSRLNTCYALTGERELLEEAIACAREAVLLTPEGHKDRPSRISNLGTYLYSWYALTGSRNDLTEAINYMRLAIDHTPADGSDRAVFLSNLGVFLRSQYDLTEERDSLKAAISCARDAIALTPPVHSELAMRFSNISSFLSAWYGLTAERDALSEAIEATREAVARTSAGHMAWPDRLNNLGIYLGAWYNLTGDRESLAEAIECARQVLQSAPDGHANRPFWLNTLSARRCNWYVLTGEREALQESIACAREAVSLLPPGHSDLPGMLNNLGNRLGATGERDLLVEALDFAQRAVALVPPGHGDRPACLSNLGDRWREWYAVTGDREALSKAVDCAREAVASSRIEEADLPPARLRVLHVSLAGHLMERGDLGDWDEAHRVLNAALDQQNDELGRQHGERPGLDYLRNKEDLYRLAVRCCLELARRREEEGAFAEASALREQAWYAAEQGKGRLFAAMLAAEDLALDTPADPRVAELLSQIRDLRQEQVVLEASGTGRDSRQVQREELRGQIGRRMAELQELDPESASLTAPLPISLTQLRAILPPQGVLVELYPLAHELVIFAIDQAGLRVRTAQVSLAQLTEWTHQLDAMVQTSQWLDSPKSAAEQLRNLLAALGAALEPALHALLGPVSPVAVAEVAPELILVPTGPLHRWPLHLLPRAGGILWDAWSISYVPPADTLFYCAGRRPEGEQPLLLAPDPKLAGSFGEAVLSEALGWAVAVKEAATVQKLAGSVGNFALVTHVEAAPQQGGSSLIRLWGGEDLGWVTAVEIRQLMRGRPPAEHGELGSCAAHYEEACEGDHLQGLTRSLLKRLRSMTSTLWPVDDLAACYLGTRFRELMAKGWGSKAACLRRAALELREDGWAGAAKWLISRVPSEGSGRRVLLALAAAYCRAAGDPMGCLRQWELCLAADGESGSYAEVLEEPKIKGLEKSVANFRRIREVTGAAVGPTAKMPLTELHWGPNVLIGDSRLAQR